jgi:hypothetical protein
MAQKFLSLASGIIQEAVSTVASAGVTSAGKIPALDANGLLDISTMPLVVMPVRVHATTTNATPLVVTSIALPPSVTWGFEFHVLWSKTTAQNKGGNARILSVFGRDGGNIVECGTQILDLVTNMAGTTVSAVATTITQSVDLTVTGTAAGNIAWSVLPFVDKG